MTGCTAASQPKSERRLGRDSLEGLAPALGAYQLQSQWTRDRGYWNLVCNSGIALGALAIADEAKDEASQIVGYALQSVPHGIANLYGRWSLAGGSVLLGTGDPCGMHSLLRAADRPWR